MGCLGFGVCRVQRATSAGLQGLGAYHYCFQQNPVGECEHEPLKLIMSPNPLYNVGT